MMGAVSMGIAALITVPVMRVEIFFAVGTEINLPNPDFSKSFLNNITYNESPSHSAFVSVFLLNIFKVLPVVVYRYVPLIQYLQRMCCYQQAP